MVELADVDGVLAATVTTDRGLAPCPSARLTPLDPRGIAHTSDCYLCALLTHISANKITAHILLRLIIMKRIPSNFTDLNYVIN
jgi:hypothetical protein